MQPMNYTIDTSGGLGGMNAVAQGAQFGANIAQTRQQIDLNNLKMQQAREQARQEAYKQKRFQELAQNPTAKGVMKMMVEFPELSEQFKRSFDVLNENEKKDAIETSFSAVYSIKNGDTKSAVDLIDRKIEAAKNSGDQVNLQRFEMLKNAVVSNPQAALVPLQALLASNMGADKWAEMEAKLDANKRANELQPATKRKLSAEAEEAEIKAKFAPQNFLAELGLKESQTRSANASAASSYASAANSKAQASRANAEAAQISSGVIPAEKRPEAEAKLRDEYYKRTAVYQDVKNSYGRVLASKDDPAGDIALIFGYMKMLDPGSVVREGEFATAQNAAGVPQRVLNAYNKALSGDGLSDGQRKMFKEQAKAIYDQAAKSEKVVRSGIDRMATGYGLNKDNVFYRPVEDVPQAPALPEGAALPNGFKIIGVER